jgi:hypothetical protein
MLSCRQSRIITVTGHAGSRRWEEQAMTDMVRTFDAPDVEMKTANGNGHLRILNVADVGVGYVVVEPGFRWSKDIKTLPGAEQWMTGDLCGLAHIGVVLEGTYHYELADGRSFDVHAGEMYDVPAGLPHDEWVVGDEVCRAVDIWPGGYAPVD